MVKHLTHKVGAPCSPAALGILQALCACVMQSAGVKALPNVILPGAGEVPEDRAGLFLAWHSCPALFGLLTAFNGATQKTQVRTIYHQGDCSLHRHAEV